MVPMVAVLFQPRIALKICLEKKLVYEQKRDSRIKKNVPATTAVRVCLWITPGNVPNSCGHFVCDHVTPLFGLFTADNLVPRVLLKITNGFRHETGRNKVENDGWKDKEPAQFHEGASAVNDDAHQTATQEAHDSSDRNGFGLDIQRYLK